MKYFVLAATGGLVTAGIAYYSTRTPIIVTEAQTTATTAVVNQGTAKPTHQASDGLPAVSCPVPAWARSQEVAAAEPPAPAVAKLDRLAVSAAVDILVSPQASYEQKRAAWKQLRENGGLDQAMLDLQQRLANNASNADYAAVLGHAYLTKCGTISDVRDQGMLAMAADKLFDAALSLDPQNWEARFTKAVALSYWPASMGKSDEVIQHFQTLIQQQETQPAQPQFAESYVWLGDQYKKAGRLDDARTVWERGSALYPNDQKLAQKLAGAQ